MSDVIGLVGPVSQLVPSPSHTVFNCAHDNRFGLTTCSNRYKCKFYPCSNKYPCKQQHYRASCGCVKPVTSSQEYIDKPATALDDETTQLETDDNALYTYRSMIDIALDCQLDAPDSAQEENELTIQLLNSQRHPDFPHIIAVEWYHDPHMQHLGKGDLVFSDRPFPPSKYEMLFTAPDLKQSSFRVLIIEVKGISGSTNSMKRSPCYNQNPPQQQ